MLSFCGNTNKEIEQISYDEVSFSDETTENATIYYSDSAKVKVKLSAPVIDRYHTDEKRSIFEEGVHVEFYNGDGAVESTITSDWAINYEDKKLMEARIDVVVTNIKGEKLNTEHLVWDRDEKSIYSDDFVKITTEDEIIYGDGLLANEDFTEYSIQHIKGIIAVEEDEEVP